MFVISSRSKYNIMPIELYHYTDYTGYRGIKNSKTIRKTTADRVHARYGHGVYFSSLTPDTDKSEIATCNYQGGGDAMMIRGRVDYYVKVKFSKRDPNLECVDFLRDVYLYKNNDICLCDSSTVIFGETGKKLSRARLPIKVYKQRKHNH